MKNVIRIQVMNTFTIYVNERIAEHSFGRSRKGLALLQYLIVNRGSAASKERLLELLWGDERGTNPENALKTLISRTRMALNEVSDGLGDCIVANSGGYRWKCLAEISVDLYEIEDIFERLEQSTGSEQSSAELYARLMELYTGDLLQNSESKDWALSQAVSLHSRYLAAVYAYVEELKAERRQRQVVEVCRVALDVDPFDEQLHMLLMSALIETRHTSEALKQYRHVVHMYYRYLGVEPSPQLQAFYRRILQVGESIEMSMDLITEELIQPRGGQGPYVCEYSVFKEIYGLQMRNLERLETPVFLGVIMVDSSEGGDMDTVRQDTIMANLRDILMRNLRRGDTITRYSPTMFALLLPTVDYTSGTMVMERVKRLFFRANPNSDISYTYRIAPLSRPRGGGQQPND